MIFIGKVTASTDKPLEAITFAVPDLSYNVDC